MFRVQEFVQKAKDKNDHRLMGFGHRVYKNYDPRAKVMKETCDEVLAELGVGDDPQLKLAMELERIALKTSTSLRKALSQRRLLLRIILKAIGIPVNMFTVIFATGRTPGGLPTGTR